MELAAHETCHRLHFLLRVQVRELTAAAHDFAQRK